MKTTQSCVSYSPGHVPGAYGFRASRREEKPTTTTSKDHATEIHRLQKQIEARRKEVAFRCFSDCRQLSKTKCSELSCYWEKEGGFPVRAVEKKRRGVCFRLFCLRRSDREALPFSLNFLRATPSARMRLCGSSALRSRRKAPFGSAHNRGWGL